MDGYGPRNRVKSPGKKIRGKPSKGKSAAQDNADAVKKADRGGAPQTTDYKKR
jgi:hypothetical protein